jgi:hypothetical protein
MRVLDLEVFFLGTAISNGLSYRYQPKILGHIKRRPETPDLFPEEKRIRIIKHMENQRDTTLDRLRGLAIFLMILDHALVIFLSCYGWQDWAYQTRRTVTRLSMPLFMLVSGLLVARKGRPSIRRLPPIFFIGLVFTEVVVNIPQLGFGAPDILLLWLLCLTLYPLWIRWPVEMAVIGILQIVNWPITIDWWRNYQPGEVLAFLALGALLARRENSLLLRTGAHLPRWLAFIGRRPLVWYTAHLTALLVLGAILLDR